MKHTYKEELKQAIPMGYAPARQLMNSSASGVTMDGLIGVEYRMGLVLPFLEAGYSFSTKKSSIDRIQNLIPSHYHVQLGIKIPLQSAKE